jgi:uncharacterized DUF497 family protein
VNFEWDEAKNRTNIKKHGVSFNEAATIFADKNILSLPDEEHSESEERWVSVGISKTLKVLFVAHLSLTPQNGGTIRIFSARKADPDEERDYAARALETQ